jgi:predicted nucleotide-binding protein
LLQRTPRRVTFFVEKRWEDAIRRQSDLDGLTYTQIVNEAFRYYFESGSRSMSCTQDHG